VRIMRVAGRQASRPLLIGLKVGRMLKRKSGLNKLMSIVHSMSMEFESKFVLKKQSTIVLMQPYAP